MTLCIAAICHDSRGDLAIVGASDRMVTAPDFFQYEPNQPKVVPFTDRCIGYVAGDYPDVSNIVLAAFREIRKHSTKGVVEVADIVGAAYVELQRHYMDRMVLGKYGLTYSEFPKLSGTFSPEFVRATVAEIIQATKLDAEFLVAGVDEDKTTHLYRVSNGVALAGDATGFAAIGLGADIAETQFMTRGYTRYTLMPEAMWLVYYAKRAAEAVPSVGREGTDLFTIQAGVGFRKITDQSLKVLERAYQRARDSEQRLQRKAIDTVRDFLNGADPFTPRPPDPAPKAGASAGPPPSTPGSSGPPPLPGSDEFPSPAS